MPQLRQYPEVTSTQGTDAVWLDRIGVGTVWTPVSDLAPGGGGDSAGFDTLALFRAAIIPSATNVVQINGYRAFGDGGAVTLSRASSPRLLPGVWQSADGAYWQIMPVQVANWLMFGAFNDGQSHQITSADIAANPQWIGTYSVGTEWSSVAAQECVYYCFAGKSVPGSVAWSVNSGNHNRPMRVPVGNYVSNDTLLIVAEGVDIHFDTRFGTVVNWFGSPSNPAIYFNSISEAVIQNMAVTDNVASDQLIVFDNNGSPGGAKTQQISIRDAVILGGGPVLGDVLVSINPVSAGNGQGDTIIFDNCLMIGSQVANVQLVGQNTLSIIFLGGNQQSAATDGIACYGATAFVYGTSFENGTDFFASAPVQYQFGMGGADFQVYEGAGATAINSMRDVRSETNIPFIDQVGNGRIDSVGVSSNVGGWGASAHFQLGYVISAGTKGHLFMLVDDGGPDWFLGDVSGSTTTAVDLGASWTTNQWAGFAIWERFTNGLSAAGAVVSNTATVATVVGFGLTTAGRQIKITGLSGSSPPSWDSAPAGKRTPFPPGNSQGFTTTANSAVVAIGSDVSVSMGDYVVIPGAWSLGQAGSSQIGPLIGKVLSTGAGTITISRAATVSLTGVPGYFGTSISDGNLNWLDFDNDALAGLIKADAVYVPYGRVSNCQTMEMMQLGRLDWDRGQNDGGVLNMGPFFSVSGYQQQQFPQGAPVVGSGGLDLTDAVTNSGLLTITVQASCTLTWPTLAGPIQGFEINAQQSHAGVDTVLTMAGSWTGPATVDLGSTANKITHITAQWDPNLTTWVHKGTTGPY